MKRPIANLYLLLPLLLLYPHSAFATVPLTREYTVQGNATVQAEPPEITLSWLAPCLTSPTNMTVSPMFYSIRRRLIGDPNLWSSFPVFAKIPYTPGTNRFQYVDRSVETNVMYEYLIEMQPNTTISGNVVEPVWGIVCGGIHLAPVHTRGTAILLVDANVSTSLTSEIALFIQDLVGDGWRVLRHDVPRSATPPQVKQIIQNEYDPDLPGETAVILLGRIAIPYSGTGNLDGHADHSGATPSDVYYQDLDGLWTDESTSPTNNSARIVNRPGDGKFDQGGAPTSLEVQLGRIDLRNMTYFPTNETALLQRYLAKDHNFRHALLPAQRKGLISDHWDAWGNLTHAKPGWRNFPALFGTNAIVETDTPITALNSASYLWAALDGPGYYAGIYSSLDAANFNANNLKAVFITGYGSYFYDWDVNNAFLRAPLCGQEYGLASLWHMAGTFSFQPMSLGKTIGFCRIGPFNHNNPAHLQLKGGGPASLALLGDPTLRLHAVAPVTALSAHRDGETASLLWSPSVDPEANTCFVYRAPSLESPFTLLTPTPSASSSFTDPNPPDTACIYMVRAQKQETSGGGTYANLSQGAFASITHLIPNTAPIALSTNVTTTEDTPAEFTIPASDTDNDTLSFCMATQPLHGVAAGFGTRVLYMPATNYHGSDTFSFALYDGHAYSATTTVTITITPVNDSPRLTLSTTVLNCQRNASASFPLSATDVEGSSLTYRISTAPAHGTAVTNATSVLYTPETDFLGHDTFGIRVSDGQAESDEVTLHVLISDTSTNGLIGYYFNSTNFLDFAFERIDPNIYFSWTSNAPDPSISGDYSVRWVGKLRPNYTEIYTFRIEGNGDYRLRIDGQNTASNWTGYNEHGSRQDGFVALNAGELYSVEFEMAHYTGGTNAFACLKWKSVSQTGDTNAVIPSSNLFPDTGELNRRPFLIATSFITTADTPFTFTIPIFDPDGDFLDYEFTQPKYNTATLSGSNITFTPSIGFTGKELIQIRATDGLKISDWCNINLYVQGTPGQGQGLQGEYFNNSDLSGLALTRTDTNINFNWASGTPDPAIAPGSYSVRWTGRFLPMYETYYIFYVASNGGVRLKINGNTAINTWEDYGFEYTQGTAPIRLAAGQKVDIILEYLETNANASVQLLWRDLNGLSSIPTAIIPQSQLFPPAATTNHPPVAQHATFDAVAGVPAPFQLSASDPDADELTVIITRSPAHGTLSGSGSNIVYTSARSYAGTDFFCFKAIDDWLDSNIATVTVAVAANPDLDSDQMDDAWELTHFNSTNAVAGHSAADWDLDGFPNLHEFIAGTSPTNPASLFLADLTRSTTAQSLILSWHGVTGRTYSILWTRDPLAAWTPVPDAAQQNRSGTGSLMSYTNTVTEPRTNAFFRIRVEKP